MNRESAKKLSSLLDSIEASRAAAAADQAMRERSRENFVDQFIEARDQVIRPAMQRVLEALRARGHDGAIDTSPTANSAKSEAIEMQIYLGKERPNFSNPSACPSIRFTAEAHAQKVAVHISRMPVRGGGGSAGPAGDLRLGDITKEKVEELVVSVLEGLR